jgi:hypothetical protein
VEEIYYLDRPSIPATQQNIIHIDSILEHSIIIDSVDINPTYVGYAVEVRNSSGAIEGTLVYFPAVTHAQLTTLPTPEYEIDWAGVELAGEIGSYEGAEVYSENDEVTRGLCDEVDTLDTIRQERLLNLELQLASAKLYVQDLEYQIADEEGALD